MATLIEQPTVTPYRVASGTFVVPQYEEAPPLGHFYLNSMVIQGKEPVVVDTGTPVFRDRWLEAVSDLVDPEDVKWIFLTHDDRDHAGNLMPALETFPNATLLTTWFQIGRMAEEFDIPIERVRFMNDGDTLQLPDRTLLAVRPPFFDNPTTRGLFDDRTGVLWSVDTFGVIAQNHVEDCADWDEAAWRESLLLVNRLNHPWFQWLDTEKFDRHVARTRNLPIKHVASCHAPALHGAMIDDAFELIRRIPSMEPWEEFTQADLEQWMSATMASVGVED